MMLRSLAILALLTAPAIAANELTALVPSSSAGVYAVLRNPSNQGQGWDSNASGWATYDRTDSDQQISMGSAIAVGATTERQFGDLPSGPDASRQHTYDVYDSDDELLGTHVYRPPLLDTNTTSIDDDAITTAAVDGDVITSIATANTSNMDASSTQLAALTTRLTATRAGYLDGLSAGVLNAAGVRTAVGLSAANLDTQLSTLDTNVDAILVDTDELQADLADGGRLDLLVDSIVSQGSANASAIATVDGNVDSILVDTGTTLPAAISAGGNNPTVLQSTTIDTLTSQTVFTLDEGAPDDDAYNGCQVVLTDQGDSTQKARAVVRDYVGSTGAVTLRSAPGFTIAAGDSVAIIASQDGAIQDAISQTQNLIEFQPDRARTWVPRRGQSSLPALTKRTDESVEFYVDLSKQLGTGESLAAADTFSVNVGTSGVTVASGWPKKESATVMSVKLSGGTAGTHTVDIEFETDQDSDPIEASVSLVVVDSE